MKYNWKQINNININEYSTEKVTRSTGGLSGESKEDKEYYVIDMPDNYQWIVRFDVLIEPWIINPQPKDVNKLSRYWEIDERGKFDGFCSFFLVDNLGDETEIMLPSENHRYSVVDATYTDLKREIQDAAMEPKITKIYIPVGPLFSIDLIWAMTN